MHRFRFNPLAAIRIFTAITLIGSTSSTLATAADSSSYAVGTNPQTCAPAGFLKPNRLGAGHLYKDGELHYCAGKTGGPWKKNRCTQYVRADEFVKIKSGRADARYSGMSLVGREGEEIVLFYCLPPALPGANRAR